MLEEIDLGLDISKKLEKINALGDCELNDRVKDSLIEDSLRRKRVQIIEKYINEDFPTLIKMSSICLIFKGSVFPNSNDRALREIEKMDVTIEKINVEIFEKKKKISELNKSIKLLQDPGSKLEGTSSSKDRMILSFKRKIGLLMKHIQAMEEQLAFFEKTKYSLETSAMSTELAQHIHQLKKQVQGIKHVDADQIIKDAEEITETNNELEDFNSRVRVTMNAWNTDLDIDEDEVDAYLAEIEEPVERVAKREPEPDRELQEANTIKNTDIIVNKPKAVDNMERERYKIPEKMRDHSF